MSVDHAVPRPAHPATGTGAAGRGPRACLPLLRRGTWYVSRDGAPVPGGITLSLAPEIMIRDDAARLRATRDAWPPLTAAERRAMLREAVELFRHGRVPVEGLGEQTPEEFAAAMRVCAGLPPALVRRWSATLHAALQRPPAVAADERAVTLVSLPSNTFTCLEAVLEALATSGAVWIRPSRREPLSSARLVGALLAAGWPAERLGYYPTSHAALPALIGQTTRQIVYGGERAVRAPGVAGAGLDLRGPGRTCAIVDPSGDPRRVAERLAVLVAADAGRFCTNVSVIVTTGDVGPVARHLAALLDGIRLTPPDPCLPQACVPAAEGERVARLVADRLTPGARVRTRRPLLIRDGDRAHLAPTLITADHVEHPLVGCELPFPFAVAVTTDDAGVRRAAARARFVHHVTAASP